MEPLAGLDNEYQVLTELHRSGDSRTYLARHLSLQRDVTISTVRAVGDRSYLDAFARDVELLKTQRHPSIIPVIEGRWIDVQTFAVIRARVRGSSLDGLISAVGAMPPERIRSALREITGALVFARDNGVVNRFVSPESLVFQQGTGRALLSFEPSRLVVDDAQTIRELASSMNGGQPFDVTEFLAMLTPGAAVAAAAPLATPLVTPAVPPSNAAANRPATVPVGRDDSAVVVRKSGMGFGARVLTTFVVLAALVGAAIFFWPKHAPEQARTANTAIPDTQGDAAGDVALHSGRSDAAAYPQSYPTPVIVEPTPTPTPQPPMPQPMPAPVSQQPLTPYPYPTTPRPTPPIVQPEPAQRPAPPVDTAIRRPTGDVCDSPSSDDQHQCLMSAIERSDRGLNAAYQRLITALRNQAGVADADPDPQSVQDLRAAQRRWLEDRDEVCRGTGSGLLYARERATCFADRSAQRQRELEAQIP